MGLVNVWSGSLSAINSSLALKAPLASPALTGVPTTPTAAVGTNTSQIASTAFVIGQAATAAPLMAGTATVGVATKFAREDHKHPIDTSRAPVASPAFTGTVTGITATMVGLGNVTNESKATMFTSPTFTGTVSGVTATMVGLGNVVNESKATMFTDAALTGIPTAPTATAGTSTTQIASTAFVMASIAGFDMTSKANVNSPTLTGVPTAPTASAGTNTTQIATTAFVATALSSIAGLVSPALSGVPTTPTAAVGTNTTQIASTAFVIGQAATANPSMNGSVAVGTATKFSREDHVHPSDSSKAPLASPGLSGVPTAPTAAVGTNSTQLATTAFVKSQIVVAGSATVGVLAYNGVTPAGGQFDASANLPAGGQRLNYSGYFYATRIYNGVFNDLAEFMTYAEGQELNPGDVLASTPNGIVKAKYGDKNVVGVYSDTYGYALGADEQELKVPVGISGRVKVYIENPELLECGALVIAGDVSARIDADPKRGTIIGKIFDTNQLEDGRYWMMIALM